MGLFTKNSVNQTIPSKGCCNRARFLPQCPYRYPPFGAAQRKNSMICISLAQESRRMALADMVNAARAGDLVEDRLDSFQKAGKVGDLLASMPKPIILSSRRTHEGSHWHGHDLPVSSTVNALEATFKDRNPGRPLAGQMLPIVGTNVMALRLGRELKLRGFGCLLDEE